LQDLLHPPNPLLRLHSEAHAHSNDASNAVGVGDTRASLTLDQIDQALADNESRTARLHAARKLILTSGTGGASSSSSKIAPPPPNPNPAAGAAASSTSTSK
jgi:hypothetical protein